MNTPTTSPTPDTPNTPGTPDVTDTTRSVGTTTDGAPADEVFVDSGPTAAIPTWAPGTATATAAATAAAPTLPRTPAPAAPPEPEWIKGPAPFALVLGLLGLVVAAGTLLAELTDVSLPWNDLGPWSVVAAGIVVLLVGAVGLRSSRSRS